ncbi:MAG: chemotaxis response regulator protein-glutamate methylesterase [Deltaproteobacteria bacterium]|jgi:two-component system, chemotaxis family, protein-glutamate methylesterase/glutaminase|nr:chemotaxis response regulator protein-glutamate methylesterase [Deltaproteobacteria bacterium]MBT4089892.1 chemotaxis response regulator protein-glutamate methylesterase [Deltaproteobacteria bacterium]MBT4266218.1 chemotaxis response regulator protein-glutamate methylesterase [Deltaproteobacteria bacterium]MBT4639052.1 chemotaxis response regulator protein-glutamate methylesterase [Deltaproteobacteria bacterium]MBT6499651.1 chemotaxis response regulator protein-glutamate methylesterase [Delt
MKIKVLVVDDTIFYRKVVSDILNELPGIEVVGTANNGEIALSRIRSLKPDLITLDIEMPVMNGLQLLEEINKQDLKIDTIMLSSKTLRSSEATMQALQLGAFDFIAKPDDSSADVNKQQIKKSLNSILQAYKRHTQSGLKIKKSSFIKPLQIRRPAVKSFKRTEKSHVIAIGISTGGPNALAKMIPKLPADIGVPILLVQHMPPVFTASLAKSLDQKSGLAVKEAANGEEVLPNTVYIAPGGSQMMVASGIGMKKIIRISADAPAENNCKPSVDYLFRSVSREYGSKSTCVIMTGMGMDGKLGMTITRAGGAISIAQEAESCVVYGMPKAVIEAGLADIIAPLENIADEITKTL